MISDPVILLIRPSRAPRVSTLALLQRPSAQVAFPESLVQHPARWLIHDCRIVFLHPKAAAERLLSRGLRTRSAVAGGVDNSFILTLFCLNIVYVHDRFILGPGVVRSICICRPEILEFFRELDILKGLPAFDQMPLGRLELPT